MSLSINKKVIVQVFIIVLISTICGVVVNQVQPNGISLKLLFMHFSSISRQDAWKPVATDDAFFAHLQDDALFIDIRSREEFGLDHIAGARSIPFAAVSRAIPSTLDTSFKIIIYDFEEHSERALAVTRLFLIHGYRNTRFLRGGFSSWLEYGFPVEGISENE